MEVHPASGVMLYHIQVPSEAPFYLRLSLGWDDLGIKGVTVKVVFLFPLKPGVLLCRAALTGDNAPAKLIGVLVSVALELRRQFAGSRYRPGVRPRRGLIKRRYAVIVRAWFFPVDALKFPL